MEYEIIRSARRTVAITVKQNRVILRAPYTFTDKQAEKIIRDHKEWIEKKLLEIEKKGESIPKLDEAEISQLRKAARQYFKEKLDYFSEIMNLKYGKMSITGAKTRFGSCSSHGNISFSYLLMLYPEPAREYVVVHELAHLIEMNHSKRFDAIVERYLPDYKIRKKLLKNR